MFTRIVGVIIIAITLVLSSSAIAAPTCPSGQHWVNAHHQSAYVRADGTPVSAAHVSAHCQANPSTYSEGWVVARTANGKRVFVPRLDGFVEEDGTEGPNEDFSNNIEYYLFNPKTLHEKTPKVYDWIRKRYGEKFRTGGSKE